MTHCDYCGRENEPTTLFCSGCGTAIPVAVQLDDQAVATDVPPRLEVPQLNGWRATNILVICLVAQFVTGILVGIVIGSVALARGTHLEQQGERLEFTKSINPPAIALSFFVGGVASVLASVLLIRGHLKDRTPVGAAWVLGSTKAICQALVLGLLAAITYIFVASIALALGVPKPTLDPLSAMVATPGLSRILLVISVLLLAPLFEELLFRGVLYGGYRQSLGSAKAAVLMTGIFVFLHIGEWIHFLPALIGITGMAALALWLRLRSGAIGPAIAAHFGYNAALVILLLLSAGHSALK